MPLMTKIRENLSTAFAVFAGVFVVYIVLDWGMDISGRHRSNRESEAQRVGQINGQNILYKDFAELMRQTTENQKKQTGNEPDETQLKAIRDQLWERLVEQKLYEQEIQRLGIMVTDQEIVDWVRGDNPPDFLRSQFTDSAGTFHRDQYEGAIRNPQNKAAWIQVEEMLRSERARQKLVSTIATTVRVSEGEMLARFTDQNTKYNADFIFFDPNQYVQDSAVTVTDEDLRRYYNEHSEDFKVEATRRLSYVTFSDEPAKGDTDAVLGDLAEIKKRADAGADFTELAKISSEVPPADAFFKHNELSQEKETAVFAAKAGDLLGPLKDVDGYHLIKVLEFRQGKDDFIRASHILIGIENNDSVNALKRAKDILSKIRGGSDFAALAKTNSKDPGSGARGGDLGWFGKGRMVPPFERAAFNAPIGQLVGPVKTQFGYHIIKVTGRDKREVKITDIKMTVKASAQTRDAAFQAAQDFDYLVKKGDFQTEAKSLGYKVSQTQPFQKGSYIPGIGTDAGISKFAFSGRVGECSQVYTLQSGFAVFMLSEKTDAGIRHFEELKQAIEPRVKREKKLEKLKTFVEQVSKTLSPTDSLQKVLKQYPNMQVLHLAEVTLLSSMPAIGRDAGFNGALSAMEPGKIAGPVEGTRGYYIIRLLAKTPFDEKVYNAQRQSLQTSLLNEKRNRFIQEWMDNLKKSAEIVDNRDMFYR